MSTSTIERRRVCSHFIAVLAHELDDGRIPSIPSDPVDAVLNCLMLSVQEPGVGYGEMNRCLREMLDEARRQIAGNGFVKPAELDAIWDRWHEAQRRLRQLERRRAKERTDDDTTL